MVDFNAIKRAAEGKETAARIAVYGVKIMKDLVRRATVYAVLPSIYTSSAAC
jgi:hypothetical protein